MSNQSWKETATTVIGLMGIGVVSNILTPLMACGIPRIQNVLGLKIRDVRVEHHERERIEYLDDEVPELLDIKYDQEMVTIFVEDKFISSRTKDMRPYSFGFDSGGSGGLGIMLFGIPGTLVCLPLILLCQATWHGVYKLTGMDVNYYLFFRRIKDQLPADTRAILKEALIKTSYQNKNYNE